MKSNRVPSIQIGSLKTLEQCFYTICRPTFATFFLRGSGSEDIVL